MPSSLGVPRVRFCFMKSLAHALLNTHAKIRFLSQSESTHLLQVSIQFGVEAAISNQLLMVTILSNVTAVKH